jgi:hypothetical protein
LPKKRISKFSKLKFIFFSDAYCVLLNTNITKICVPLSIKNVKFIELEGNIVSLDRGAGFEL